MLIGKSLTALGGGGLKPEICVTAKAGALLNLHYKDSSIILQSYQLGESETQYTFVVEVSDTAYVVEDVTNSASIEVLVDSIAQYSVEIMYTLYLYDGSDNGNEFIDVTGGWVQNYGTNTQKESSYIVLTNSYGNYCGNIRTSVLIDVTNYSVLKMRYTATGQAGNFGVTSTTETWKGWANFAASGSAPVTSSDSIVSANISDISGSYYIYIQTGDGGSTTLTVKEVWLE